MRVYVSGSITNGENCDEAEITDNLRIGSVISLRLRQLGHIVLSPFLMSPYWVTAGYTYSEMMTCSYLMILEADCLLMIPNFSQSKGALDEKKFAEDLGKPIYYSVEEL